MERKPSRLNRKNDKDEKKVARAKERDGTQPRTAVKNGEKRESATCLHILLS